MEESACLRKEADHGRRSQSRTACRQSGRFCEKDGKKYESLVPLPEVISTCMGYSTASKKVQGCFEQMIQTLGTEFDILRNVPSEDIKSCAGERIAEGIENVRTGNVKRIPGYDGEYGKIELFEEN